MHGRVQRGTPGLRSLGFGIVMAFTVTVAACSAQGTASETYAIIHSGDERHGFTVEIADSPEETSRGLMFRDHLDPNQGMLFDFYQDGPRSFWMQNTLIPLDMIFIQSDGTIVNIHANARPLDTTGIPSAGPARFVLEIAGGRAAELGLEAGDTLEHPRVGTVQ